MGISKETFDDRLVCQKKIYLLQSLGTDLGYTYNWYVRGPYSPALTNYVYNNIDVLSYNDLSGYKLSQIAETNVNAVNGLANKKPEELSLVSWYELLASLLYIYNNREGWGISNTDKSLFDELINHKPQYSDEQCKMAYHVLKEGCFIKEEIAHE